jgi:cobalt-zinc-cadmium efflux system membrane fusion protein
MMAVRSRLTSVALAGSVGLLAGTAAAGCRNAKTAPGEAASSEERGPVRVLTLSAEQIQHGAIRWALADQLSVTNTVETTGQLVPDEDRTAHLGATARGRIVAVRVNVGDRVFVGQVLVTLQSQEAASARADYAKAMAEVHSRQAAATFARGARGRAERLLELKAISRQDVERARTDDDLAQAAQAEAEIEVERARTALEHLGVTTGGEMVLRTPISGVVLKRDAVPGSVVDAGAPLVTVTDPSSLWLQASVTEAVATTMRPGAVVQFAVPAFPDQTFEARAESVGAGLDPLTRTLSIRAVVQNRSGRLRPEMFAKVWVGGGVTRTALVVPEDAIQLLDDHTVVFVARSDDKEGTRFERRDVEVGSRRPGRVEIVKGLRPGESVVVQGAFAVKSEFARSKIPAES